MVFYNWLQISFRRVNAAGSYVLDCGVIHDFVIITVKDTVNRGTVDPLR